MAGLREEFRIFGSSLAIMVAAAAIPIGIYLSLLPEIRPAQAEPRFAGTPVRIELPSATPITDDEAERRLAELTVLPAETIFVLSDAETSTSAESDRLSERLAEPGRLADFTDAALPADLANAAAPALTESGTGGLLSVEFDLSDPYARSDDGGSAIEIRKTLRVNGVDVGPAAIRVSAGSTLSIARDELGGLLARVGRDDVAAQIGGGSSGGFVTFDEMRRQGIQVRYDASSDRVVLAI